jgi:uncharacterized protein YcaQ
VYLKRKEFPLVEDAVQALIVAGCQTLYCLRNDVWLLEALAGDPAARAGEQTVRLLAPLDPLIYDRTLTARLWNFDYTWEAYTPPAKRVRGYFAMPVLAGTCIVGHVDPKVNRETWTIRLNSRRVKRGHRVTEAVQQLKTFLRCGLRSRESAVELVPRLSPR